MVEIFLLAQKFIRLQFHFALYNNYLDYLCFMFASRAFLLASPPQTDAKSLFSFVSASLYGTVPNLLQSCLVSDVTCLSFFMRLFIHE